MVPDEGRSNLVEQLFDSPAVFYCLLDQPNQASWHVHTSSAPLFCEGQKIGGMIVAAGAGTTLRPDARFAHLGQGAFEGGPQSNDLACEGFLGRSRNFEFHIVCIYY